MDLKSLAEKDVKGSFHLLKSDIKALPQDAIFKKFSDQTRSVADIIYEITLVNDHICRTISKKDLFDWPEGWITAPSDWTTKEQVMAAIKESANLVKSTLTPLTEEEMSSPVETEHGPTNILERFQFIAKHNWYHSGQLNYIQTLIGDDQWHWN